MDNMIVLIVFVYLCCEGSSSFTSSSLQPYGYLMCMGRCPDTGGCSCFQYNTTSMKCTIHRSTKPCVNNVSEITYSSADIKACGQGSCAVSEVCMSTRKGISRCVALNPKLKKIHDQNATGSKDLLIQKGKKPREVAKKRDVFREEAETFPMTLSNSCLNSVSFTYVKLQVESSAMEGVYAIDPDGKIVEAGSLGFQPLQRKDGSNGPNEDIQIPCSQFYFKNRNIIFTMRFKYLNKRQNTSFSFTVHFHDDSSRPTFINKISVFKNKHSDKCLKLGKSGWIGEPENYDCSYLWKQNTYTVSFVFHTETRNAYMYDSNEGFVIMRFLNQYIETIRPSISFTGDVGLSWAVDTLWLEDIDFIGIEPILTCN